MRAFAAAGSRPDVPAFHTPRRVEGRRRAMAREPAFAVVVATDGSPVARAAGPGGPASSSLGREASGASSGSFRSGCSLIRGSCSGAVFGVLALKLLTGVAAVS